MSRNKSKIYVFYKIGLSCISIFFIIIITTITTLSFSGIAVAAILIFYFIVKKVYSKLKNHKLTFVVFLAIVFSLLILPATSVISKKLETGSGNHRILDIKNGLQSFADNPIIGQGINHKRDNEIKYETGYGYSNAIIPVITDGGILLLIIYIYPLIYSCLYI